MPCLAVLRGPGGESPLYFVDDDLCTVVVPFPGDLRGIVGIAPHSVDFMNLSQTGTTWTISVSIGGHSPTKPSARDGSAVPFMISRPPPAFGHGRGHCTVAKHPVGVGGVGTGLPSCLRNRQ